MSRSLSLRFLAVCVLAALPQVLAAQTPSTNVTQNPPPAPAPPPPLSYIAQAKILLDTLPEKSLSHEGTKLVASLRDSFGKLETSYAAREAQTPAATQKAENAGAGLEWQTHFSEVERNLAAILGGGALLNPAPGGTAVVTGERAPAMMPSQDPAQQGTVTPNTGTPTNSSAVPATAANPASSAANPSMPGGATSPGAANGTTTAVAGTGAGTGTGTGTAVAAGTGTGSGTVVAGTGTGAASGGAATGGVVGVAVSDIGIKNLDPNVRAQLDRFRVTVELFFDATTQRRYN